ncbi:MAG: SDR family NAD(P)-dependent oxidoreductase [Gammaproteobacteria bacterium]
MTAPVFDNKVAVITGASGGIGDAIGRAFVDAGARVVCADLQPPPEGSGMLFYNTDVCDERSVQSLFAFAEGECGGVDVLVSCAGVVLEKPVLQTSAAEWDRIMAVNARGVFLCAKNAAMAMKKRGGGAIVNIGSIEALGANPSHAAYAASKGAVHSLTRNLALELGADNIRCNAVAPGWIDTPFNDNLLAQYPNPAAARKAVNALHPLGKSGKPEDVAALVLWLASENAAFANGQVYIHDGGRTACLPLPPL